MLLSDFIKKRGSSNNKKPSKAILQMVGRYVKSSNPDEVEYAKQQGESTSDLAIGERTWMNYGDYKAEWKELVSYAKYAGYRPIRSGSGDRVEWVYASVKEKSLPRVRRNGVQPRYGKLRVHPEPRFVYAKPDEVVVRFPWPSDWWDAGEDSVLLQDGRVAPSTMFTDQMAPPEVVQVKQAGAWVPLVTKQAKV